MGKITSTVPKIKDFDRDENIGLNVQGLNDWQDCIGVAARKQSLNHDGPLDF